MDQNKIVKRRISEKIDEYLAKYPIVALTGPRQSGKTTLLKNLLPTYQYVSLENPDQRAFAADDPTGFLKKYNSRVIFDEAQRVPALFSYIQTKVDETGEMGQFVLSGSQNFMLLQKITQSLAGRVAIFKLLPFDISELAGYKPVGASWEEQLIRGFYPAIYDRQIDPTVYYANYVETYINRDVSELVNVHDHKRFDSFIQLCAGRVGQILSLNNLANECGISQPTAKSWLSILESSYLVYLLKPYFENFNKRIVKSPKLYFYDTGLLSFLLGIKDHNDIGFSQRGALFENLIISEILKRNFHQYLHQDYWYWRDSNNREINILTVKHGGFDLYEIKSTQTVLPKLFKNLDFFENLVKEKKVTKNLIYGGNESQSRSDYNVINWRLE